MRKSDFRALGVLALLAVLLCYSYDFECLLESQGCQQQAVELERDSDCAQPGLVPAVVALLSTTPGFPAPTPRTVTGSPCLWQVLQPPVQPLLHRPLGQRAPPAV